MIKKFLSCSFILFLLLSCSTNNKNLEPSWYLKPTQNTSLKLYGTAQGPTLESATKSALADMAAKLIVTISSTSSTEISENNYNIYEEYRQKISQNIEDITFTNYQISNSKKIKNNFFVEVSSPRDQFFNNQLDRFKILDQKINSLDQSSKNSNIISRQNQLFAISQMLKEAQLKLALLKANNILANAQKYEDKYLKLIEELQRSTTNIEFFIAKNNHKLLNNLIIKALNKENIKISQKRNKSNKNQILLQVTITNSNNFIYNNFINNQIINFKNIANNKIIASNKITIKGSSVISEEQAKINALKLLEQRLQQDNILKIIGILPN